MGVVPVLLRVKTPARWLLAKAILMGETCRPDAPALLAAKANTEEQSRLRSSAAETRNKEANIMKFRRMYTCKPQWRMQEKMKKAAEQKAALPLGCLLRPTADARGRGTSAALSKSALQ